MVLGTEIGWQWRISGVGMGGVLMQQWDKDGEGGGTHSALSPYSPPRALLDPVVSLVLLVLL